MKRLRLIAFASLPILALPLFPLNGIEAAITEEWVVPFNGAGSGHDEATAMALDGSGNVYVAGQSQSASGFDFATVKYANDGTRQWVAPYDGSGGGNDKPTAIETDDAGNVYVTGYSVGLGTANDYTTIKYDVNGNQLWVAIYNGPGNSDDQAAAMALDAAGNVYVTGSSGGNFATVKYDANGNELWVAGNRQGSAAALALDGGGNVYVAGAGNTDFTTIKYDNNGIELWFATYNGPGNGTDIPAALAVDDMGNSYITGRSLGAASGDDYATVKYDPYGTQMWVSRYNSSESYSNYDKATDLVLDQNGNVYVTGYSAFDPNQYVYDFSSGTVNSDNGDYATIKYDANGTQLWAAIYDNAKYRFSDGANALAVDASGNVYVTGFSSTHGHIAYSRYATVKYDTYGNFLQEVFYDGAVSDFDIPVAILVDANENIYVTGGNGDFNFSSDYATIKYNQPNVGPIISAISPTAGSIGSAVMITGIDFGGVQGSSTVTFNGVVAAIQSWGNLEIIALVPQSASTGPVVVTVNDIESNADQIFTMGPIVTGFDPLSGVIGTPVTITGQNFNANPPLLKVTFNNIPAPILAWSNTQIQTQVPESATTGPVVVTSYGIDSNADKIFSVLPSDFTMTIDPLSQAVKAGECATYTVSLAPVDLFLAEVSLFIPSYRRPPIESISFNPKTLIPPGSSTLTVCTTQKESKGDYVLTISARGGGQAHSIDIGLTVGKKK